MNRVLAGISLPTLRRHLSLLSRAQLGLWVGALTLNALAATVYVKEQRTSRELQSTLVSVESRAQGLKAKRQSQLKPIASPLSPAQAQAALSASVRRQLLPHVSLVSLQVFQQLGSASTLQKTRVDLKATGSYVDVKRGVAGILSEHPSAYVARFTAEASEPGVPPSFEVSLVLPLLASVGAAPGG